VGRKAKVKKRIVKRPGLCRAYIRAATLGKAGTPNLATVHAEYKQALARGEDDQVLTRARALVEIAAKRRRMGIKPHGHARNLGLSMRGHRHRMTSVKGRLPKAEEALDDAQQALAQTTNMIYR
jgi:hypothetical protein